MKLKDNIIFEKINNSQVIYDGELSLLHTFNDVGGYLVRLIKKKTPEEKIIQLYANKYKLSFDKAKIDINVFFDSLKKKKIFI